MNLHLSEEDKKGAATAEIDGRTAGKMTYSKAGGELLIIDHTEVEDFARGKGVGKALFDALIALARSKKVKVMTLCPFAKAMAEKTDGLDDVIKR